MSTGIDYSAPVEFTYNPIAANLPENEESKKMRIARMLLVYGQPPAKDVKVRFLIGITQKNTRPGKNPKEVDKFNRNWTELRQFSSNINWRRILSVDYATDFPIVDTKSKVGKQEGEPSIPFPIDDNGRLIVDDKVLKVSQRKGYKRTYHPPFPFMINGVGWLSVDHFLLGMLYRNHPEYSVLYSLNAQNNPNGFWGDVKGAKDEHIRNIQYSDYEPDMNFDQEISNYLRQALLAKFTQNPIAKKALLLTDDAIISIEGGDDGILDINEFIEVREYIKANPTVVYLGSDFPMESEQNKLPILSDIQEMNFGYIREANADKIAGSITTNSLYNNLNLDEEIRSVTLFAENMMRQIAPDVEQGNTVAQELMVKLNKIRLEKVYLEHEKLSLGDCYVHLHVGALNIDIGKLMIHLGKPKLVERPVYAMELRANDGIKLVIGVQRTPTNILRRYLYFPFKYGQEKIGDMYLEPFAEGFQPFIIASTIDYRIIDYLNSLSDGYEHMPPRGKDVKKFKTPVIIPAEHVTGGRGKLNRTFHSYSNLNKLYNRLKAMDKFTSNSLLMGLDKETIKIASRALERLLIGLADLNGEDIFADNPSNFLIYEKFNIEIDRIKLNGSVILEDWLNSIKSAELLSETSAEKSIDIEPSFAGDVIRYRELTIPDVDDNEVGLFQTMLDINPIYKDLEYVEKRKKIAIMYMAHRQLDLYGNQWSLLSSFAECLHDTFNINLEAFSSPLNSVFIRKGVSYCSLFDEIDKPFASLGNLFRLDISRLFDEKRIFTVMINPPFLEQVLNDVCDLIEDWFRICAPPPIGYGITLRIFFIAPKWPDAYHTKWLQQFQGVYSIDSLEKGKYYFQLSNKNLGVPANFDSTVSIITNNKNAINYDGFKQCLRLMTTDAA